MSQKVNSVALRLKSIESWKLKTKNFDQTYSSQLNILLLNVIKTGLKHFNLNLVDFWSYDRGPVIFFFVFVFPKLKRKFRRKKFNLFLFKKKPKKRFSKNFSKKKTKNIKLKKKIKLRFRKKLKYNSKTIQKRIWAYSLKKQKNYTVKKKINKLTEKYWFLLHRIHHRYFVRYKKKIIKDLLVFLKLKLKLQNQLETIFKFPVVLNVRNIWDEVPPKYKEKCKRIFWKAKQYKKNKNLQQLINVFCVVFLVRRVLVLTDFIANELEKKKDHWAILNSIKYIIHELNRFIIGVKGFRLSIWGKINNAKKTRKFTISMGQIALNNLNFKVDHYMSHSYTPYGIFGIKSWIIFLK